MANNDQNNQNGGFFIVAFQSLVIFKTISKETVVRQEVASVRKRWVLNVLMESPKSRHENQSF